VSAGDAVTVLDRLAALVSQTAPGRRARVAIDGRGCSGKTTLADRLASAVAPHRPVVRAGIDDFNQPRAHRYRRGLESARGCYEDTFDFAALRTMLIDPLGPDGSGLHQTRVFDVVADQPVDQPARLAAPNAVLLFDGCRLLQPDLANFCAGRCFATRICSAGLRRWSTAIARGTSRRSGCTSRRRDRPTAPT
jgi:uridine kinase